MYYQMVFFILFTFSLFGIEHVYLKTPHLSRENMMGTNVGIRPYRKGGVRIEPELIQDKLIIHNYGYGGSGLTLCLGGSKQVLDILNAQNPTSKLVAVLGAGIAGLTTAYDLLEQGYEVHLYSDKWSPHLTSNVAAGIWSPPRLPEDTSLEKKELYQNLLETSRKRFLNSIGVASEFAGVRFIDAYIFRAENIQAVLRTQQHGEEVIVHFDNGVIKTGKKNREIGIDGKLFIEDLHAKIQAKGALFIQRCFENLDDILSLEEATIINCTSMGSRKLFNDESLIPVRGQIIYFNPQEEMNVLLHYALPDTTTTWVSIYPWSDRMILGGIYEHDESEVVIVPETIDKMMDNAEKCLSGQL